MRNGQNGAGMLGDWGMPGIAPAVEPRISENARRVVVLRHWVEALESDPRNSPWYEQQLMQGQAKLREQAPYVIGWGC